MVELGCALDVAVEREVADELVRKERVTVVGQDDTFLLGRK
jgi:hypothetical protein